MAFMTSSGMMVAIDFHGRPIITRSQNFLSHHMPTGVSTKDPFMHIFHNLPSFLLIYTVKQSRIMVVLVQNFVAQKELGGEPP